MIEIFRRNLFLNSLLLLPLAFIIKIRSILHPSYYVADVSEGTLNRLIFNASAEGSLGYSLIGIFLIFIQAVLINRLVIKGNLSKDITLVSGLIYVTMAGLICTTYVFHPILIANVFVILCLTKLFNTYNIAKVSAEIYLSGVFGALASIFYFPLVILFLFTFLALIIMRSFSAKERIQHLLGWITPYYLLITYEYWINSTQYTIPQYFLNQLTILSFKAPVTSLIDYLSIVIAIVASIYFILNINLYSKKTANAIQKRISLLYWFLLLSSVTVIFYQYITLDHLYLFAIPASFFTALAILNMKNKIVQELIYLILFGLAMVCQFFPF